MGFSHNLLLISTILLTLSISFSNGGGLSVKFSKAPLPFSSSRSSSFVFEIMEGSNSGGVTCKLDNHLSTNCESKKISYTAVLDGHHTLKVCINGSGAAAEASASCATHNWTVDTVRPTAGLSVASPFTSESRALVNISFSEPCTGRGGFQCTTNHCNFLVYGSGAVLPSTLKVIEPDLRFSLVIAISDEVSYGRLVLVMDKDFCTDSSGNMFTRTENSRFFLHFDRRTVTVNMRSFVEEKLVIINHKIRTVEATNDHENLQIYLHFSSPLLNSSSEILGVLRTSVGELSPTNSTTTLGSRRFGFLVRNLLSISVVSVNLEAGYIISRQGTPVSPTQPMTFLYDSERPSVSLTSKKSREHKVPRIIIRFDKPVFDFNSSSSSVLISGGHLQVFHKISMNVYSIEIEMVERMVSLKIPENVTRDIAGNKNIESNLLQVIQHHDSIPLISYIVSTVTTVTFVATTFASAFVSFSTGSLLSFGAISEPSTSFVSNPSRNLMRIAYHLQVFAQSKWLVIDMPDEYYEFARGIDWVIPYLYLPWESKKDQFFSTDSSQTGGLFSQPSRARDLQDLGPLDFEKYQFATPLTPMEYRTVFENQNLKPEVDFVQILQGSSERWGKDFKRNMFCLSITVGGLTALHLFILLILKIKRKSSEKNARYGELTFPRFEIFLVFLAVPCIFQASTSIIKGGTTIGVIVGSFTMGIVSIILLTFQMFFISFGITTGKLLRYKEIHQNPQSALHWYQWLMDVCLGSDRSGQWSWRDQQDSINLIRLGPLFEDIRGPPNYINASDEKEASFIQKLMDNLRIYYPFLESTKRACLGIMVGIISAHCSSSKIPTILVLCIASFQLLFLVLEKPFINSKVQIVEIISLGSEVGMFAMCLVLTLVMDDGVFSEEQASEGRRLGLSMLVVFMVGYFAQLLNEWRVLFRRVLRLSPDENSFYLGLRTAMIGVLLVLLPTNWLSGFDDKVSSGNAGSVASFDNRSGGGNQRSWVRQLREIAKDSFIGDRNENRI